MLSAFKRLFSRKKEFSFNNWVVQDYLESARIDDIEIGGRVRKLSAQQYFKDYAEYETVSGLPYAPEISYKDINILFYPLFIVIESRSTMADSFFVVMRPAIKEKFKIKTTIQLLNIKAEENPDEIIASLLEFLTENLNKVKHSFK